MDLFDYKPYLDKVHNQEVPESVFNGQRLTGMTAGQSSFPVARSIFNFEQTGKSGIWLNTENAEVVGLPSFYHILTTKPLDVISSENTLRINKLGFDHIPFRLARDSRIDDGPEAEWKEALVRNMQKTGLWSNRSGEVEVISDVLFRADIEIPANIMPGDYNVRILHFRDGAVVEENLSTLNVVKSGLSAEIYRIAHEYAAFYGIFAIIFAVASGWLAAVAFRK